MNRLGLPRFASSEAERGIATFLLLMWGFQAYYYWLHRLLHTRPFMRFHRWHHADVPEAHGKNLANIFPFFDWMFGTYRVPGPCDAPVGAAGIPRNDVVKLTLWPLLEWARLATLWVEAMRARIAGWLARGASLGKTMPFDIKTD